MKIYCNRALKYTLDWFVGKPVWVLCYISRSPYMSKYLVKLVSKVDGYYTCHIIHANFIGRNEKRSTYMEDTLAEGDLHIVEPVEIYGDLEHSNWISKTQYRSEFGDAYYDGEDVE